MRWSAAWRRSPRSAPPSSCSRTVVTMAIAEDGTLDGLGLAELVRRRQVSPAELLEEAIARNERVNPHLGAVITTVYADARRVAGAFAAKSAFERPFAGVPFLVKDI